MESTPGSGSAKTMKTTSNSDASAGNPSDGDSEANGPSAFFKRLRRGVAENTLPQPVPGLLRIIRAAADPLDEFSSRNSSSTSGGNVSPVPSSSQPSSTGGPGGTSNSSLWDSFLGPARSSVTPARAGVASNAQPSSSSQSSSSQYKDRANSAYHIRQFDALLAADTISLTELRALSWNGIPHHHRPAVWQLLLGYAPMRRERRAETLRRKRAEYHESLALYFTVSEADRTTQEGELLRQILVDLARTCPDVPFFHQAAVQRAMERVLYIWSIRHSASGYVQGMNDLLTPILLIAIQPFVDDPLRCDAGALSPEIMADVEADAYWCFTKLMDNIQDHYTFSQPGIQRMIHRLAELTQRLDADLHRHLTDEGIVYMQFAFRWMNCALIRELPLRAVIRMWDTYFAEDRSGFDTFHVYVCCVLLRTFREEILSRGFQDIFMFLQDLPTSEWDEESVEPLLSQAFILSKLFENAPSHLN